MGLLGSSESALKGSWGGGLPSRVCAGLHFSRPMTTTESAECWGMAAVLGKSEALYQKGSAKSRHRPIATRPDRETRAASAQTFTLLYLYIRRRRIAASRVFPDHAQEAPKEPEKIAPIAKARNRKRLKEPEKPQAIQKKLEKQLRQRS